MRKITKKRLNAFANKAADKARKAETMTEVLRCHRALNRATLVLCCHHQKGFKKENYKPLELGLVLKKVEKWKNQREIRRWMIQAHPTFCCPVSGKILDLDRSFLFRNIILDFEALRAMKPEHLQEIDLEGGGGLL